MTKFVELLVGCLRYAQQIIPDAFLSRTRMLATGEKIDCIKLPRVPNEREAIALKERGFIENLGFHGKQDQHATEWIPTNHSAFRGDENLMHNTQWTT